MPSNLKSETARINGAKSKGPVTPEGKARSSTNARRHGLASAPILLPGESKEDFQQLLADYMDQFHPRTPVETDLVETMAISRWRLRRVLTFEASLFDEEMQERDKSAAWVFQKFANYSTTLTVLLRYEGHLNRSFDKALNQLLLLSKMPVGQVPDLPSELPNEPKVGQVPDLSPAEIRQSTPRLHLPTPSPHPSEPSPSTTPTHAKPAPLPPPANTPPPHA